MYSVEMADCPHYSTMFNEDYDIITAKTETEFFHKIHYLSVDGAIICFCSAREYDVENILRLDALTGPIAVLICSKILNPEFVSKAAQQGVEHFLTCDMETEKIVNTIDDAIRYIGLKKYFKLRWPNSLDSSPHVSKLVDEIIRFFPQRMKVEELAAKLGINRSWLHKLCKESFGRSLTALMRHIWVYQALYMMQNTNLKNLDITMQLNYSEESSMARDFRKELGCCPNEARKRLTEQNPEDLLL
ncbi:MAG: AraC family transcriptional regulator [Ignavibacteriaceae bacterium]